MVYFTVFSTVFFLVQTFAQSASSYLDSVTGITFQGYTDSDTGFTFGLVLPEDDSLDFVGQIVAPATDGEAWAGISLGGGMVSRLLVVAWPNGEAVVSSLRQASGYANPAVFSGPASMVPIDLGTFVNETHFSYTFVCSGCLQGGTLTFDPTTESGQIGYAVSSKAPIDPSDPATALNYHSNGFGIYGITVANCKSADYANWAAMAGDSSPPSSSGTPTPTVGIPIPTPTANSTIPVSNSTYDYIVAGGGAAGIIVAERLAESGAEVLLIERGQASTYASGGRAVVPWNSTVTQYDVPAYAYYLSNMADTSEYCDDTASQAGCILGGGTMVNALMFVKPQQRDFDDKWPSSWKWADVEAAADRLYERNPGTSLASMDGERYDQGAFDIMSSFLSRNGFTQRNALLEPDAKHQIYSYPPWNIKDGKRAGPVMTYLPLAQSLPNFHMTLNTKVVRAIRSRSVVTGVEVETSTGNRQIINVKSNGKVILSVGALSTPRILFNSGIGPSNQIQIVASGSSGVNLPPETDWIDLPVGKGLKDHPIFTLKFSTKNTTSALVSTAFTSPSLSDADLFAHGAGLLSQSGQRLNFWTSVNTTSGSQKFIQGTCNMPSNSTIQMKVYLTHGLTSTGSLGITGSGSTEFIEKPWMTTGDDKEAMSMFLDTLLSYSRSNDSALTLQSTTGSNAIVTGADLIANYVSGSHFVGTAKMGTDDGRSNGTAVVDLDTKVYGTDNLFVVDASFHPDLPTGNTQAIVMVAAEAAAARILALDVSTAATSSLNPTPTPTKLLMSGTPTVVPAASSTSSVQPATSTRTSLAPLVPAPSPYYPEANDGPSEEGSGTKLNLPGLGKHHNGKTNQKRNVNDFEDIVKSKKQPISLDIIEDVDMVEKRIQWERASYLDSYYRDY